MIASAPQSSPFTSSAEAPLASLLSGLHLPGGLKFVTQYEAGSVIITKDPVTRFYNLSCLTAGALFLGLALSCVLVIFQDYRRHAIMYVLVPSLSALCLRTLLIAFVFSCEH
jgi:uncharacterized membrane protein YhdT